MKQKVLSLFLAACMTAALVAGCGSTKNTANMENGGTENGSTVSNSTESATQTADTAASESGDYTRAGGEGGNCCRHHLGSGKYGTMGGYVSGTYRHIEYRL